MSDLGVEVFDRVDFQCVPVTKDGEFADQATMTIFFFAVKYTNETLDHHLQHRRIHLKLPT